MSNNETKIEKHIAIVFDSDQDGYCAANIVYGERKSPTTSMLMYPVKKNINMELIQLPEEVCAVCYVDLCPSLSYINNLIDSGFEVMVIDHHKTTCEALEDYEHKSLTKVLDVDSSSCMLAWNHYHSATPAPWVVCKIHEWDKWEHADPQVVPFHYGMACLDIDEKKLWKHLLKGDANVQQEIIRLGSVAGTYWVSTMNETVEDIHKRVMLNGKWILLANGAFNNTYEFAATFNHDDYDAVGWWYYSGGIETTSKQIVLQIKTDKPGVSALEILKGLDPIGSDSSASTYVDFKTITDLLENNDD